MSSGEWLRAGIPATNPPPPAQQFCHLLRGAGPQRKEGCQSTHPLSEHRPPLTAGSEGCPSLAPPPGGGGRGRAGGQAGEGTPQSITVWSFPKYKSDRPERGGAARQAAAGSSYPWRAAGPGRAGRGYGGNPGWRARRWTKASADWASRWKGVPTHSPYGSEIGARAPRCLGRARCSPTQGPPGAQRELGDAEAQRARPGGGAGRGQGRGGQGVGPGRGPPERASGGPGRK